VPAFSRAWVQEVMPYRDATAARLLNGLARAGLAG
jgi:hypothetical protein